jgi:hypothetical protein
MSSTPNPQPPTSNLENPKPQTLSPNLEDLFGRCFLLGVGKMMILCVTYSNARLQHRLDLLARAIAPIQHARHLVPWPRFRV